jgi:glycerol uptake facilitator-like aquaporin
MITLRQNLIAEFLGTMFLTSTVIGSTILSFNVFGADMALAVLIDALATALVLFALIETLGSISGAHFNPAVTLALMLNKEIRPRKAAMYIAVQFIGAFAGMLITHIMFFDTRPDLIVISQNAKSAYQCFGEVVCAFLLVGVIFGCVKGGSRNTSLSVAFVVGGMIISSVSTMFANPALTFARMFTYAISGIAPISAVLFIIAELIGAALAFAIFARLLFPAKLKHKCDPYECPVKPVEVKL